MATNLVTTCDNCGTAKGSGNHWFRVAGGFGTHFEIREWDCDPLSVENHACSDACVVQFVQKWLSIKKEQSEVLCEKS